MDRGEILNVDSNMVGHDTERKKEAQRLIEEFKSSDEATKIESIALRELVSNGVDFLDHGKNIRSISGFIFEQMALNYYYNDLAQNKDNEGLAVFLKSLLEEPNTRVVNFYEDRSLEPDFVQGGDVVKANTVNTDEVRSSTLFPGDTRARNPDGLLVDIRTDETTGKKVALIVGAIDAKMSGKISTDQLEGFKESLWKLVKGLKPDYINLVKNLDLDGALPEEIDIVPIEKMGIKILRPHGLSGDTFTQEITDDERIFLPVTRTEIDDLSKPYIESAKKKFEKYTKTYGDPFRLRVNFDAIKKYDESGEAIKFVDTWIWQSETIEGVTFKAKDGVVGDIELKVNSGEIISIPVHIFRSILGGGIDPPVGETQKGIYLHTDKGQKAHIDATTPESLAKYKKNWETIVRRMAINGSFLPENAVIKMDRQ